MDELLGVNILEARDNLDAQHDDGPEVELFAAPLEEILEGRT